MKLFCSGQAEDHFLLKDEETYKQIHKTLCNLGRIPAHSIPLIGWLTLVTFGKHGADTKRMIMSLSKMNLFKYIYSCMELSTFQVSPYRN